MFCTIEDCDRYATAKRMCTVHWERDREFPGDLEKLHAPIRRYEYQGVCSVPGCEKKHDAKGLCMMHRARVRTTGSLDLQPRASKKRGPGPCQTEGCSEPSKALGRCSDHLQRPRCSTKGCKKRSSALHGLCRTHRSIEQAPQRAAPP